MQCVQCEDAIDSSDQYYEIVTPVEGGGETMDKFCSVSCLNQDVGFSDEEIKSLMRQSGYEPPLELSSDWVVHLESEIEDILQHRPSYPEGEYFHLYEHVSKNFEVDLFHVPDEDYYEVTLWTYSDDDRADLHEIDGTITGVHRRAIYYAEKYMEAVESGEYDESEGQ